MKNRKLLQTLELEAGVAKIYQLKGRDIRELLRMSKDLNNADLAELVAIKSTLFEDKDLTMDILDEMSAADYLAILNAQNANFTVTTNTAI